MQLHEFWWDKRRIIRLFQLFMDEAKLKAQIHTFVAARFQLTLATFGDYPWIATLYYSCDDKLNLYFLSDPATIHCRQLAQNPRVAVAIADSPQSPASKKQGIQLWGVAEQIKGKSKIVHALDLWRSALAVTSSKYSYEGMVKKLITGRMYVIRPKQIKLFDEELGEHEKERTLILD